MAPFAVRQHSYNFVQVVLQDRTVRPLEVTTLFFVPACYKKIEWKIKLANITLYNITLFKFIVHYYFNTISKSQYIF